MSKGDWQQKAILGLLMLSPMIARTVYRVVIFPLAPQHRSAPIVQVQDTSQQRQQFTYDLSDKVDGTIYDIP